MWNGWRSWLTLRMVHSSTAPSFTRWSMRRWLNCFSVDEELVRPGVLREHKSSMAVDPHVLKIRQRAHGRRQLRTLDGGPIRAHRRENARGIFVPGRPGVHLEGAQAVVTVTVAPNKHVIALCRRQGESPGTPHSPHGFAVLPDHVETGSVQPQPIPDVRALIAQTPELRLARADAHDGVDLAIHRTHGGRNRVDVAKGDAVRLRQLNILEHQVSLDDIAQRVGQSLFEAVDDQRP